MGVRHLTRSHQSLSTSLGLVRLGEHGLVTNQEELKVTEEELLQVPELESTRLFPIPGLGQQTKAAGSLSEIELRQVAVIKELMKDPVNLNSASSLEMNKLNRALGQHKLPGLNGAGRDRLAAHVV